VEKVNAFRCYAFSVIFEKRPKDGLTPDFDQIGDLKRETKTDDKEWPSLNKQFAVSKQKSLVE